MLNQNNPLAYTARGKVMHNMPKLQWKGHTVKEQWLALWPQIKMMPASVWNGHQQRSPNLSQETLQANTTC